MSTSRWALALGLLLLWSAEPASGQTSPNTIPDCNEQCVELQDDNERTLGFACVVYTGSEGPVYEAGTCEGDSSGCGGAECSEVELALVVNGAPVGDVFIPCKDSSVHDRPVFAARDQRLGIIPHDRAVEEVVNE